MTQKNKDKLDRKAKRYPPMPKPTVTKTKKGKIIALEKKHKGREDNDSSYFFYFNLFDFRYCFYSTVMV